MPKYLKAKKDNNHDVIASYFTGLGWSWIHTYMLPGFVDGIAGKPGFNALVEIKDGSLSPSRRKLREGMQVAFHAAWRGPVVIIGTFEDVVAFDRQYQAAKWQWGRA